MSWDAWNQSQMTYDVFCYNGIEIISCQVIRMIQIPLLVCIDVLRCFDLNDFQCHALRWRGNNICPWGWSDHIGPEFVWYLIFLVHSAVIHFQITVACGAERMLIFLLPFRQCQYKVESSPLKYIILQLDAQGRHLLYCKTTHFTISAIFLRLSWIYLLA